MFLGHPFDRICAEQWVEHRLTQPNHPRTHGRVERMNQTIKDATIMRYHCELHGPFLRHLADFVSACDFAQRLETLKCIISTGFVCKRWAIDPELFRLNPLQKCQT